MKIAVYPGSFNPWHKGHDDILLKALAVFDKVVVARGINPEKKASFPALRKPLVKNWPKVKTLEFSGMLNDLIKEHNFCAIIRGLRNGDDLQYEMNQQYWYEDLGVEVPIVYFVCDRSLSHISSSAIRAISKIKT